MAWQRNPKAKLWTGLTFTAAALLTGAWPALAGGNPTPWLKRLPQSGRAIAIHPFAATAASGQPAGFGLVDFSSRTRLSFRESVRRLVADRLANEIVELRDEVPSWALTGAAGGRYDLRYYVRGTQLCDYHVAANALRDGAPLILGSVPEIADRAAPAPGEWPAAADAEAAGAATLARLTGLQVEARGPGRRCLVVSAEGGLIPVWEFRLRSGGLPYRVLADAWQTRAVDPIYFDVDGKATVYQQNILSGSPEEVDLKGLTGDGSLSTQFLTTKVNTNLSDDYNAKTPKQKAAADDHVFTYEPEDFRFDEVQAFYHATVHQEYAESIGFSWYGPKPLELRLHYPPYQRRNNALYIPGSDASADGKVAAELPSITIDDGDGKILRNLVSDADVVAHEFGHHVLYRTLQSTTGESLVLHEGLADFLAFARTGDSCLGESICPEGSGACQRPSQCLRSGTNDLIFGDLQWEDWLKLNRGRLGHLHGQLVSGLLWDLWTDGGVPKDLLPRLVVKAGTFFQKSSGLRDFVIAMLAADRELGDGSHQQAIYDSAEKRGLAELMTDINLSGELPAIAGGADSESGATQSPTSASDSDDDDDKDKDSKFKLKCGVAGAGPGSGARSGAGPLLLLALMLMPALAATALGRVRIRVAARTTAGKVRMSSRRPSA